VEQFLIFVVIVIVLYLISRKYAYKEAIEYVEENNGPKESSNLSKYDPALDAVVDFTFKCPNSSFLITSKPNIVVNGEVHKLIEDVMRLRLPLKVSYHFGVPYMKGEPYKPNGEFTFEAGYHYSVVFKSPIFVFSKVKVKIEKLGPYKG